MVHSKLLTFESEKFSEQKKLANILLIKKNLAKKTFGNKTGIKYNGTFNHHINIRMNYSLLK